jgi:hypothetical protein
MLELDFTSSEELDVTTLEELDSGVFESLLLSGAGAQISSGQP